MTPIEAVRNLTLATAAVETARIAFLANNEPSDDERLSAALRKANRARAEAEKLRRKFAPAR